MPLKCCIPNCKSDCCRESFTLFKFPTDGDLKKQWIEVIPLENFRPSKSSRVCELHFPECDIERDNFTYQSLTGEKVTAPLNRPRLKKNAVPSQFPKPPSKEVKKESPSETQMNNLNEQLKGATLNITVTVKNNKSNYFGSFDHLLFLTEGLQVSPFWEIIKQKERLIFAHFDFKDAPTIESSVVVDKQLILRAYFLDSPLETDGKVKIPKKVSSLDEILTILEWVRKV